MKKAERILGIIAVVAVALNLLEFPGGSVLTVLSLSLLATAYMYLSFALFNGIRLRHIFKRESYRGISVLRIVGAVLTGFTLGIAIAGILFRIQSWPGASISLTLGFVGLLIALVVGSIKYSKNKSPYYVRIFQRVAVYGGLAFVLMAIPTNAWLEFRYRNHPEYLQALQEARANPENQELWDRVDEEREKMNKDED